jgi:hypothetical protein
MQASQRSTVPQHAQNILQAEEKDYLSQTSNVSNLIFSVLIQL